MDKTRVMENVSLLTQKHLLLHTTTDKHGVPPTKRLFKVAMLDPSPNLLVHGERLEIRDYQLWERKKFDKKCNRQTDLLKEKDAAETARVGELDSLKERNAALEVDKGTLEGQVAALESATAAKDNELASLTAHVSSLEATCFGLRDHVSGYELFKEQYEVTKVDPWDLRLVVMKCLQSPNYLATLGGSIGRAISKGMQDGLVAGIDHGKAGRCLTDVAANNLSAKSNYVSVVNALCPVVETPKANQLQPSPKQLMLPIHRPEDQVVNGETCLSFSLDVVHARVQRIRGDDASHRLSLSDAMVPLIEPLSAKNLVGEASMSGLPVAVATTTALSTTFVQANSVLPIPTSDYEVVDTEPRVEASYSPKIIFEHETLETSLEHPAT
ncbi:hypothetical protein Tco_1345731 [Tanacetum coccineum]